MYLLLMKMRIDMKQIYSSRYIRTAVIALMAAMMFIAPVHSFAGVFVSVAIAPPVLPIYDQPVCPGDGYIWTPGYWAYGDDGYYWVPGTWVMAPEVGFLWTPGYWGWGDGFYLWHAGYWGPHVGFYGGVNYGFGYFGVGFFGGRWDGGHFLYNTSFNPGIRGRGGFHTYADRTGYAPRTSRVSFNGGRGGIQAQPRAEEAAAANDRHVDVTPEQSQHVQAASQDRANFASQNHGVPAHAAVSRPATTPDDFSHAAPARASSNMGSASHAAPGGGGGHASSGGGGHAGGGGSGQHH
jgi:uncharacterized membrane protein YgcG